MIKIKDNKGITLMVLIITIVIILIIAVITITLSLDSVDQTVDSQNKSEMLIIQHAIQERYVEYMQSDQTEESKDKFFVGDNIGEFEYKLSTKDHFETLGVTGEGVTNSKFVVNYETGYVEKEGASTPPLEGYNKGASGNVTSFEVNISN